LTPLEGRVQGGLATGSSDDRWWTQRVGDPSEAVQAVTENGAGGMEIALRQGRISHGGNPSRGVNFKRLACPLVWFRPPHDRRLARRPRPLAAVALPPR